MTTTYQIRIKGHLSPQWSEWFAGLTIANLPHGEAELMGTLGDQAALFGVLLRIRDLGLPLLSVNPIGSDISDEGKRRTGDDEHLDLGRV
jgi:hypothetical protein